MNIIGMVCNLTNSHISLVLSPDLTCFPQIKYFSIHLKYKAKKYIIEIELDLTFL